MLDRLAGEGTFRGSESTSPTVGQAGRFERVAELRIESITPKAAVPAVVEAIRQSHPYEEPAFDVYPLEPEPVRGMGRHGELSRPTTLGALAMGAAAGPWCRTIARPYMDRMDIRAAFAGKHRFSSSSGEQ